MINNLICFFSGILFIYVAFRIAFLAVVIFRTEKHKKFDISCEINGKEMTVVSCNSWHMLIVSFALMFWGLTFLTYLAGIWF